MKLMNSNRVFNIMNNQSSLYVPVTIVAIEQSVNGKITITLMEKTMIYVRGDKPIPSTIHREMIISSDITPGSIFYAIISACGLNAADYWYDDKMDTTELLNKEFEICYDDYQRNQPCVRKTI